MTPAQGFGTPGNPAFTVRSGDTLSLAGVVALPAGNWSAVVAFRAANARYVIPSTLVLSGANASNPSKNDWILSLNETSANTALWPVASSMYDYFVCAVTFSDDSNPPVVRTTDDFSILVQPRRV
ncbi:hypothetical protein [Methylosinus sp. LW4]|uniref:hypothetical protein n=1 Tax=Methylosinus sp. LW4 TaxID=136993 RepID=UPI0003744651|nr:hypothetical protein [Methylosinus sp. LW4]